MGENFIEVLQGLVRGDIILNSAPAVMAVLGLSPRAARQIRGRSGADSKVWMEEGCKKFVVRLILLPLRVSSSGVLYFGRLDREAGKN